MQHDQIEKSRFGTIAGAISATSDRLLSFSERFTSNQTPYFASVGTLGLRGQWSAASTAVGALSLGMAAIAVGSLLLPQAQSAQPVAAK